MAYTPDIIAFKLESVNANSAGTDVGAFANLPARYYIHNVLFYDPSAPMSNASFDLMTGANGTGDHLITQFKVSALSDSMQYTPAILAALGAQTLRTEPILYLRNITPEGSARNLSVMLEVRKI